jgi:cytochrome c biogenesis protein CcmG, thiol:disulfide interchange protein DsbE
MKHPARWIAAGVAAVVVVFGVVLALNVGTDPQADQLKSRLLDKDVPAFEVKTLDGQTVTADDLAGKTVIVNFWNTWCVPCRNELPALQRFWTEHKDDGDVVMLGIVRDDPASEVRKYVKKNGIDWTIGLDPGAQAALDFGTRGQPETFAVSPSGRIVGYQLSEMSTAGLDAMVQRARDFG